MSPAYVFRWIVITSLLATPFLIYLAAQVQTNTQDIQTWLPNGTAEREEYDRFLALFGHDDDILASWPGCTLEDSRLDVLTERLQKHAGPTGCFRGVVNGKRALAELASGWLGMRESAARKRLYKVFLGPDYQTTGIVIQLSKLGQADRKACLETLLSEVDQVAGLSRNDMRIGGSSYINSEIERATNRSLLLSIPGILFSILITFVCLRSFRLSVITLWVAGFAALTGVALVTGLGFKINGLLVLMPVLVLVLTVSGGIHLCSYYQAIVGGGETLDKTSSALKTLSYGWRPTCMAMVTTSIGILMLGSSRIEAVRHFGFFSALSIVIALAILLTVFPSLLATWPLSEKERKSLQQKVNKRKVQPVGGNFSARFWRRLAGWVLVLGVVISPFAIVGLANMTATLAPTKMFSQSSGVNRNYQWINQSWTSLESVELIAEFPKDQGTMLSQLQMLRQIHGATQKASDVCSAFSVANLMPSISGKRSALASIQRGTIDGKLNEQKPVLIDQGLIAEDDSSRYWRLRLGATVGDDQNYELLIAGIQKEANRVMATMDAPPAILVTGVWPLSASGRSQLFTDLATSFMMAFAIITPVVMLILRGFLVGLVAMIPNVFPALLFFGGLGWFGWSVDIGTILTACVGMGIAVDDTLHFIEWYSRQRKQESCSLTAVRATIAQCARPMFFTTLICSAGLIVFAFSEFIPPRQFAYAIVALLSLALICDLVLLPALIVGPLGFVFDSKVASKGTQRNEVRKATVHDG